ncbi:hypothetical protein M3Y96_01008000 [Aphelenchoides besseyi]|nr:hypothetical protein M3Y96_01008000 [Aphelenchoides besseyi]
MGSCQSSEVEANSVPLNEVLNENGRSLKWLKEQLVKNDSKFGELAKTHEIKDAKCNRIGVGKGYCSHVYRVNFKFKTEIQEEDAIHSIVMKIPTIASMIAVYEGREISDEKRAKMTKTVVDLHNIECEAYNHLKDLKSIGFPIPAVYATEKCVDQQMGILVMQDMSVGTRSMDLFKSVTVEQSLNFARLIADFQTQRLCATEIYACFLCWCADEEVRKKIETQLLDVYYNRLTENLKRVDRQVSFSRAQAQELYELSFLHTNTTFIEMVAAAALPLSQSDKKEDLERFEVLWKRLLSALDVMHLMEKYKIVEKFGRQNV